MKVAYGPPGQSGVQTLMHVGDDAIGDESRNAQIHEISGGEQQRVVIARAMVSQPMLLLADEPTGNLDSDNTRGIMRLFREMNLKGTTVLIATHNEDLYYGSGRRVFFLNNSHIEKEIVG